MFHLDQVNIINFAPLKSKISSSHKKVKVIPVYVLTLLPELYKWYIILILYPFYQVF